MDTERAQDRPASSSTWCTVRMHMMNGVKSWCMCPTVLVPRSHAHSSALALLCHFLSIPATSVVHSRLLHPPIFIESLYELLIIHFKGEGHCASALPPPGRLAWFPWKHYVFNIIRSLFNVVYLHMDLHKDMHFPGSFKGKIKTYRQLSKLAIFNKLAGLASFNNFVF